MIKTIISEMDLEQLNNESQKNIFGGVIWWIPLAIGIAYDEIDDIWESGGDNLRQAYKDGQEWAKNI